MEDFSENPALSLAMWDSAGTQNSSLHSLLQNGASPWRHNLSREDPSITRMGQSQNGIPQAIVGYRTVLQHKQVTWKDGS